MAEFIAFIGHAISQFGPLFAVAVVAAGAAFAVFLTAIVQWARRIDETQQSAGGTGRLAFISGALFAGCLALAFVLMRRDAATEIAQQRGPEAGAPVAGAPSGSAAVPAAAQVAGLEVCFRSRTQSGGAIYGLQVDWRGADPASFVRVDLAARDKDGVSWPQGLNLTTDRAFEVSSDTAYPLRLALLGFTPEAAQAFDSDCARHREQGCPIGLPYPGVTQIEVQNGPVAIGGPQAVPRCSD